MIGERIWRWLERCTVPLEVSFGVARVLVVFVALLALAVSYWFSVGIWRPPVAGECMVVHLESKEMMVPLVPLTEERGFVVDVPVHVVTVWAELLNDHDGGDGNVGVFKHYTTSESVAALTDRYAARTVHPCTYAGFFMQIQRMGEPPRCNKIEVEPLSLMISGVLVFAVAVNAVAFGVVRRVRDTRAAEQKESMDFVFLLSISCFLCMLVAWTSRQDYGEYDCTIVASAYTEHAVHVWAGDSQGVSRFDFLAPTVDWRDRILGMAMPNASARCRGTAFRTYPTALSLSDLGGHPLTAESLHGIFVTKQLVHLETIYTLLVIITFIVLFVHPLDVPAPPAPGMLEVLTVKYELPRVEGLPMSA